MLIGIYRKWDLIKRSLYDEYFMLNLVGLNYVISKFCFKLILT